MFHSVKLLFDQLLDQYSHTHQVSTYYLLIIEASFTCNDHTAYFPGVTAEYDNPKQHMNYKTKWTVTDANLIVPLYIVELGCTPMQTPNSQKTSKIVCTR